MPTRPVAPPARLTRIAFPSVPAAAAPVCAPGGQRQAVAPLAETEGERGRVAGTDQRLGVLAVPGADVHPGVGELRHLVALLVVHQVRRPPADDAGHWPLAAPHG